MAKLNAAQARTVNQILAATSQSDLADERVCGVRNNGAYFVASAEQVRKNFRTSYMCPPLPLSEEDIAENGLSFQGQSFVEMADGSIAMFDYVGSPYSASDFLFEAFVKGTSNRAGVQENLEWLKSKYADKLHLGMTIYYWTDCWIEEQEDLELYYADRQWEELKFVDRPCPQDHQHHIQVPDLITGLYPMCAGLYFEDLPDQPERNTRLETRSRLVERKCGNLTYVGALAPKKKIKRGYAVFFQVQLEAIELVYDDVQKAMDIDLLLSGAIGDNVPRKICDE